MTAETISLCILTILFILSNLLGASSNFRPG